MSELLSGFEIEGVLSEPLLPCWLVIDRYPQTLARIYQLEPSPQLAYLFHETPYASLEEHSPLVVRIRRKSALWKAYAQQQDAAIRQGIIITSSATEQAVLAHLRQRLDMYFYGSRKALFRFYDACIASAFFSADTALDRWLGPLERVVWFGGTWGQIADHGKRWYGCLAQTQQSPHPQSTKGQRAANEAPHKLSVSQEKAMETFVIAQSVWHQWAKQKGTGEQRAKETSEERTAYFARVVVAALQLELPLAHLQKALEIFLTVTPGEWLVAVSDLPAANRLREIERRVEQSSQSTNGSVTL